VPGQAGPAVDARDASSSPLAQPTGAPGRDQNYEKTPGGADRGCDLARADIRRARAQYPYTLIDPGTFGGPSSFLVGPGPELTSQGVLLGAADTATRNSAYDSCASGPPTKPFCDSYEQHAFTWRDGRLTDLGVLPVKNGSIIFQLNASGTGAGISLNGLDPNSLFIGGWPCCSRAAGWSAWVRCRAVM
jgi:hypothetical protein